MNSSKNQVFNLLLIGYIFSKKTGTQKNEKKKKAPCLKNRLYKNGFNKIF